VFKLFSKPSLEDCSTSSFCTYFVCISPVIYHWPWQLHLRNHCGPQYNWLVCTVTSQGKNIRYISHYPQGQKTLAVPSHFFPIHFVLSGSVPANCPWKALLNASGKQGHRPDLSMCAGANSTHCIGFTSFSRIWKYKVESYQIHPSLITIFSSKWEAHTKAKPDLMSGQLLSIETVLSK
jgi:hypothetical protein